MSEWDAVRYHRIAESRADSCVIARLEPAAGERIPDVLDCRRLNVTAPKAAA